MAGHERYQLKIYDTVLAEFDFVENDLGETEAQGLECDPEQRNLLPLNLKAQPTDFELMRFLGTRRIPRNRAYAAEILRPFGITVDDTKGIIDLTKGVSLNDAYSVVPSGDPSSFREYNVFDNDLNVALQVIAISGIVSPGAAMQDIPSELTSSGMYPKAWRVVDGRRVLYKAGHSIKGEATGREPYSEHLASQIAAAMGLAHVGYSLDVWEGELCSTCKLFNSKDVSFVPFHMALTQEERMSMNLSRALEYFGGVGSEALEGFKSMLVFDALISNGDRHLGNYGIMRDNRTGAVLGFAPIFDNNNSLFCTETTASLTPEFMQAKTKAKHGAFTGLFEQAPLVLGERQYRELLCLDGFAFDRSLVEEIQRENRCKRFEELRFAALEGYVREMAAAIVAAS